MQRHGALLVLLAAVLAGCGGAEDTSLVPEIAKRPAATEAAATAARTPVDVRTPDEYASGHVPGALNLDVQAPDFRTRAAQLDRSKRYLVYCRSGNRSAQAVAAMRELGLDVEDGGGLVDMAAAGFSANER
jgi:phage shock protein E